MEKEITLVFTPFTPEEDLDDAEVNAYKNRIFEAWKKKAKRESLNVTYIDEILPTDTAPISLGQLCLISYLQKHGVHVNYIYGDYWIKKKRLTAREFEEMIVRISKNSCMVGFYSMTPTIGRTIDLIEALKKDLPQTITVLGGPHGTYADIEALETWKSLDVVARGEGEETLLELIDAITEKNGDLSTVKGITYRAKEKIRRNPDRDLIAAEEIPAPEYSVLPEDFNCLLLVMYARGCPYTCRFCAEGKIWRHRLRFRNPAVVADEIQYIVEHWKQRVIHICDSEIDAVPSKLEELLDQIIQRNIPCKLTVNLRCDAHKRLTPNLLDKMKRAGIVAYLIGSESASDSMLETMGRNSLFSDFVKTVQVLRAADAGFIFPGVMIGFPGETV